MKKSARTTKLALLASTLAAIALMFAVLTACGSGNGGSSASSASGASSSSGSAESVSSVETFQASTDFTSGEARQAMLAKSASFPSKFDLRDVDGRCYITPVRLQNPFGTCWGFAAIASAETSILGSVLADDPDAYKTLNLSEKQLAYFSHIYIDDPSNPQNGEGMHVRNEVAADGVSSSDIYNGGTTFLATNTFATGIGPVNDSRNPAFEYHGVNGNIDKKTAADGTEYDFSYSADDDWNLDGSCRYQQDYVLKESYLLPSPAQWVTEEAAGVEAGAGASGDASDSAASSDGAASGSAAASSASSASAESDNAADGASGVGEFGDYDLSALNINFTMKYSYNEAATAAIKDQLLQKRAVTVGFHADLSKPWEDGSEFEYMNPQTWAHYTWKGDMANHAVTIVGWDDDYPASNFLADHQPEGDGAWLCKNSWGSGENDFPDRGYGLWGIPVEKTDADGNPVLDADGNPEVVNSGYFWLSYYDRTLSDPEVLMFDTVWNTLNLSEGDFLDSVHRYQYDLMPASGVNAAKSAAMLKSANVFTAESDENLVYVSFEIASPGTTVSYEVYLLSPGYTSPEDGVLMASGQDTYQYGGYYMEQLLPYVTLQPGQSYSIVVTQQLDTGEYAMNAPIGLGENSGLANLTDELAMPHYSVAVVNEGESLVYENGSWQDWSSEDVRYGLLAADDFTRQMLEAVDTQYDNFPLKGFAIDKKIDGVLQLADGSQELGLKAGGEAVELNVEISGSSSAVLDSSDLYAKWNLAPGGEDLVKLEAAEGDTKAKVSGLKEGKTYLFATDVALGTTIIPVEVS